MVLGAVPEARPGEGDIDRAGIEAATAPAGGRDPVSLGEGNGDVELAPPTAVPALFTSIVVCTLDTPSDEVIGLKTLTVTTGRPPP